MPHASARRDDDDESPFEGANVAGRMGEHAGRLGSSNPMIFNSTSFAVFFALFYVGYWFVVPTHRRNLALLLGSYIFYGWWDWRFLGLITLSTGVDFALGQAMDRSDDERHRLRLLWTSVVVNLGVLGFFKYANFFTSSAIDAASSVGVELSAPTLEVLLPVGISFYTFQTMSYSFDVYRRRIPASRSLVTFATYVAFFPQLVAGPIERAKRLLPILNDEQGRKRPIGIARQQAISLILVGLFKKIVIADGLAPIVNDVFAAPNEYGSLAIWFAIIGFAIQIYGDFGGYTDIARGVSALLGIELVVNFREPHLSRNITEFWRRWHISLSDWLRDYVYVPLGGNRGGPRRTLINLMLTMLLGGLWHGASWNFVIWGGLHGVFLVAHRLALGGGVSDADLSKRDIPAIMTTFLVVAIALVPFRAASLRDAADLLTGAANVTAGGIVRPWDLVTIAVLTIVAFVIDLAQRRGSTPVKAASSDVERRGLRPAVLAVGLVGLVLFSGGTPAPFIYFQF